MGELYSHYGGCSMHEFGGEHPPDCGSMIIPCQFDFCKKLDDKPKFDHIGNVRGMLILGQEIERRKSNEFVDSNDFMNLICDDLTADLGFIVSALLKDCGPLSIERSLSGLNHFYIEEIETSHPELLPQILREIPEMVFTHLHVFPEILTYYPKPLPHETENPEVVDVPLAELLNSTTVFLVISDESGSEYIITPEQLEKLREIHENATSYPAQYIDKALWKPFLKAGFSEWENTRVLYKYTY